MTENLEGETGGVMESALARVRQLETASSIFERDVGNSVGPIIEFGALSPRAFYSARIPLWQSQVAGSGYEELGGTGYATVSFEKQREDSELFVMFTVSGEVDAVSTFTLFGVTANGVLGETEMQMYFAAAGTPQFLAGQTQILGVPAGAVTAILEMQITAGAGTFIIDDPYSQVMTIFEYGSITG